MPEQVMHVLFFMLGAVLATVLWTTVDRLLLDKVLPRTSRTAPTEGVERTDDEQMWQIAVWVKPGQAGKVCDQIRELDGVAELYRAWKTSADA